jgi:hypothetical protein
MDLKGAVSQKLRQAERENEELLILEVSYRSCIVTAHMTISAGTQRNWVRCADEGSSRVNANFKVVVFPTIILVKASPLQKRDDHSNPDHETDFISLKFAFTEYSLSFRPAPQAYRGVSVVFFC